MEILNMKHKSSHRHTLKRFCISIIFLVMIHNISFSQDADLANYSGYIKSNTDSVAFATVVIKDLGMDTITDEAGLFSFDSVPVGAYTLLVIADGFEDKEFAITISATTQEPQEFQLSDAQNEEVFQQEIAVTSERIRNSEGGAKTFDREALEKLPLKDDDPITLFEQDTGVVQQDTTISPISLGSKGQIYSRSKEFTIYGSEAAWNRYFFGNMQIPTNVHIANPSTSVITRKAVESVSVYKGSPAGIYGPGTGGTVVLAPRKSPDSFLLLGLSPTDPSVTFNFWFTKHLSFFISTRYSTFQYTILPLVKLIADASPDLDVNTKDYSYADAIIALQYAKGNHDVSFVGLGFYDNTVIDLSANLGDGGGSRSIETLDFDIVNFPAFGATGVSWEALVGEKAKNTISTYFSVYNSTSHTRYETKFHAETDDDKFHYSYAGYTRVINYTVLNYYEWFPTDNMVLTLGLQFTYLNLAGKHEDKYTYRSPELGLDFSSETPATIVSDQIYKTYEFIEYALSIKKLETSTTVGLTQVVDKDGLATENMALPSAREVITYNLNANWKLSYAVSWSPNFIEGSKFIDRILNEERTEYDNRTKYTHPTYAISNIPKLTWQVNEKNVLFLEPYFAYYYNFAGMHSGLVLENVRESSTGFKYITPNYGIGTGSSLEWNWMPEHHKYSMSYTLGYAMYDTDEYGWLPPANDYRHQLKMSYSFSRIKQFQIGVGGVVFFDKAFTPVKMIENPISSSEEKLVKENEYPFSARSYIPDYELFLNLKGTIIDRKRWDFSYRLQPGNLLGMFVLRGDEIKDNSYVGASNADLDNRTFNFSFQPTNIFTNLFLSFELTIDFPRL